MLLARCLEGGYSFDHDWTGCAYVVFVLRLGMGSNGYLGVWTEMLLSWIVPTPWEAPPP